MKLKHVSLVCFSALLFAACSKNDSQPGPPPVVEGLKRAAAKPGDTLYIKGENFSKTITENTVKFNGVVATVVAASDTELKVIVPADATSGAITLTLRGKVVEVGQLKIYPLTLYAYKSNYSNPVAVRQIVSINPADGSEAVILNLPDEEDYYLEDVVYVSATNEIVGISNLGRKLLKINVETKQTKTIVLTTNEHIDFRELVIDKYANLYAVKRDWTDDVHYKHALVQLDPGTGEQTVLKSFEYPPYWESLVYLPGTHEVAGLAKDATRLLKFNLSSKDTSSILLPGAGDIDYRELVAHPQADLYAYKGNYSDPSNFVGQIVKLNPANGQETLHTTLTEYGKIHGALLFAASRNEIITIWDQKGLYKLNITSKASSLTPLTTDDQTTYNDLISN